MEISYTPQVFVAKELREVSRDFTKPEEMIREAIHNSLDAGATEIYIAVSTDDTHGVDDELLIEIIDNGEGMDSYELKSFFDLGASKKRRNKKTIGEKGHGTKIFYNSTEVIVITKTSEGKTIRAVLAEPLKKLNVSVRKGCDNPPIVLMEELDTEDNCLSSMKSGTYISIRGYDSNVTATFSHKFLKDYILWFTAWGSVGNEIDSVEKPNCRLFLRGFGTNQYEEIPYGHPFPPESYNFDLLNTIDDRRPENFYIRRWVLPNIPVNDFPQHSIDIVFGVEGDGAKRKFNEMLKWPGKPTNNRYRGDDQYTVSERYGIYLCKDYVPIQRKNEEFAERSEWTKWHAFVNSQSFELTANRATVDNTPKRLLNSIINTAKNVIADLILGTPEYLEFAERVKIEAGRRKAELERKQVKRRLAKVKDKKHFVITKDNKKLEFLEPKSEQGVIWLLAQINALWPQTFKWRVLDIDSHFGYDLLVEQPHIVTNVGEHRFVECKYKLTDGEDFNHSFLYLHQVICWESPLLQDDEITDIQGMKYRFQMFDKNSNEKMRKYFLDSGRPNKIEVIILSRFLEDNFNLTTI
ncbi:hypothetical protein GTO91_16445 [Heliobacterium undosum]|uniref:Uncharacterized protein n=1 Tax=Heliomicrobium undosum TaxID=121734 RepID=A0A845LCA5_9FIRM|nr:ATP-binding protein [Heliomicrobium undosum]MZP31298.1 hypothetical protein [Heliomicrobium undosum]